MTAVLFLASVCGCMTSNGPARVIDPKQLTAIGIEHGTGNGMAPCYSVVFRPDGTVQYDGKMSVARKGVRTGAVPPEKFEELARFVVAQGFMELKDHYKDPVPPTDEGSTITTVVADGRPKVVEEYGGEGPRKLAEIESRIDLLF
jgi:hypothetical protein